MLWIAGHLEYQVLMCHWIQGERKGRNFEFERVQSGSSCAVLDLGFEKVSAWDAHEKRADTPLSVDFHVPLV